ncbi:site-specific integrase [Agrobacterium sp. SHOUNA12C]|nr:site-specific integrase [Agrobacterium sp. BETTINA12B]MCJ9760448.1 site-specific integrase [Agrobacterium sp. SHOUNA12C]
MGSNPILSATCNLLIFLENLPFSGISTHENTHGESMYLTHRKSGFRFQIAVPTDLQTRLGRTPIRIPLGNIPAADARRRARLLSGHVERLFIAARARALRGGDMTDIRDKVIAELQAQLQELTEQFQEYQETSERLLAVEVHTARLSGQNEVMTLLQPVGAQLGMLADGMQAVEKKVRSLPKKEQADAADALTAMQTQMAALAEKVQMSLDGGMPRPVMSECLETWTKVRRGTAIDGKKVDTDYNRIRDFIRFAGDKPVNKYGFLEFQDWSSLLTRVPANLSVRPEFKGKTHQQAADYNDRLKKPLQRMTTKTIETNYFSPLKTFFRQMAAQHDFRSPLAEANVAMSGRASVERRPLNVDELNLWFRHAAKQGRAEMKWLPLLGAITGSRIGELVFLQGKDVYPMQNRSGTRSWVLDLRTDLTADDGTTDERELKSEAARRLIAIHEIFVTVGFIKYAQSRRADDWLFPAAFYHGKKRVVDPADAASKRMNNMLKKIGVHEPRKVVYHSTRHTAKDIMRLARVDDRTNDLQIGHALVTVSRKYGSKILVPEELEVLSVLPLPDGLDLSPYLDRA